MADKSPIPSDVHEYPVEDPMPPASQEKPRVVRLESLASLRAALEPMVDFHVVIDGKPCAIPMIRLSAEKMEQVSTIFDFFEGRARQLVPPKVVDRNGIVTGYDDRAPGYVMEFKAASRQARAWAIWLAFPAVRDPEAGTPSPAKAALYVDSILPEVLQERMLAAILSNGVSLGDRVDFTSAGA